MHQFLFRAVASLAGHSIFNEYASLFLNIIYVIRALSIIQFSSVSLKVGRAYVFENPPASA